MLRFKRAVPAAALALGLAASAAFAQKNEEVRAKEVVYEKPNECIIIASNTPVRAFVMLKDAVWYATEEILVSQPLKSKTHQVYRTIGNIASTGITGVAVDQQGSIWVSCEAGVAVRNGNTFTSYTEADGIPGGKATAVAVGTGGEVWVGTENGLARFRGGSWTKFDDKSGLPSNKVQALAVNSKGDIYIGTNKGLSVYDGSKFQNYNAKNSGANGLEWNNVRVISKEPNSDVMWMTDGPKNVNTFDGKTWKRFMEIQDGINSIMNDTRRTWFGSEAGLLRFNGEDWVSDPNMLGVPAAQVYAMQVDSNGNLCFGMEKGVLIVTNPYRK
ncbi:MAG: hypothetical protein LBH93_07410 [Chitinispirillales bacterium]|jgi:hypothetical protein|nr:hypothetical protein [Chitinispirillales bacterium]